MTYLETLDVVLSADYVPSPYVLSLSLALMLVNAVAYEETVQADGPVGDLPCAQSTCEPIRGLSATYGDPHQGLGPPLSRRPDGPSHPARVSDECRGL